MLVYGYHKCSTTNKALKWLKEHHYEFKFIDNKEHQFSVDEVRSLYEDSHLPISKMFNTSGLVYREMNLKEKLKTMSIDDQLELLASNGMLIKRPIIRIEKVVLIGFNVETWEEHLT